MYPDGAVVVTAPRFLGKGAIEKFIQKHSAWIEKRVKKAEGNIVVRARRSDIGALKEKAQGIAQARAEHFAGAYGVRYARIRIGSQKTRWGSCSKHGNLSFNYKIALLPGELQDYIVVHEVCHLKEMNHSKKFWSLVALKFPNHKALRKELRKHTVIFV